MNNKIFRYLIIGIVVFIFLYSFAFCETLFPSQINNENIKKENKEDFFNNSKTTVLKVNFIVAKESIKGILVTPKGMEKSKLPALLFLQIPGESPEKQIEPLRLLSSFGYMVLCVSWDDSESARNALSCLISIKNADITKMGIIGVHEGGTQAINLACRNGKIIKALVSIAGKPDYKNSFGNPSKMLISPILLIHGQVDSQTPLSISQYFYYSLIDKGKTAKIISMPNTRHFYNSLEWYTIMKESGNFFNNYFNKP